MHNQNCFFCRHNKPFELPGAIIEAAQTENLVIFAGAGTSTESRLVYKSTLYESILHQLKLQDRKNKPTFSELMSIYCAQPDGRRKLVHEIKKRIDYVCNFPELHTAATLFHHELSSNYLIKIIITTNWDTFFEEECAALPIVTSQDFAFWNLPERKVFKIHGSMNNIGSIVATKEDYAECYKELKRGIIGSSMSQLLATKTVVFVGYSFGDEDFHRLYSHLRKELKEFVPHIYIVSLSSPKGCKIYDKNTMTLIKTDGSFFMHTLNRRLIEDGIMLDPEQNDKAVQIIGRKLSQLHNKLRKLSLKKYPEVVYSYYYQDGVLAAVDRYYARKNSGEYADPCGLHRAFSYYDREAVPQCIKRRRYDDVAYFEGYRNGLGYFLSNAENKKRLPLFYIYGYNSEIRDFQTYSKLIKSGAATHKGARKMAIAEIKRMRIDEDNNIRAHHRPFLPNFLC